MCKSVRGAAFFGSSIHLGLSFVFLSWFVFDTLISEININLWKCDPPEVKFGDIDPLAHYMNILFKLFYFIALFVTGIYIFRGVERERPQILKFATLGFVVLQIVGVIFFSVFFTIQWNTEHHSFLPEPARLSEISTKSCTSQSCKNSNFSAGSHSSGISAEETSSFISNPVGNISEIVDDDKTNIAIPLEIVEALDTVTPMVSENVLPAPDVNDTTTTPIPMISEDGATTNQTDSPATTTTSVPDLRVPLPPKLPPTARQRLPHNRLVSLVLQMCFAVTNGVGSVAYVIVLGLYLIKL